MRPLVSGAADAQIAPMLGVAKKRDDLAFDFRAAAGSPPVEWCVADSLIEYEDAVAAMEARADAIAAGQARERVWLIEHPPLYTSGTSGRDADLRDPRFSVRRSGRGGQATYHGPGQRVARVMLGLTRPAQGVGACVAALG